MNKTEIYEFLKSRGIWHEITEHEAVYNMEELAAVDLPYPNLDAKNLFVRDDKKKNYYLITVKAEKSVNLKNFSEKHNTRKLSFASENDLNARLGLFPGAVSPFGILNDEEKMVKFYLDQDFLNEPGLLGIHPNDNTATVWLKAEDLMEIIKEHGNKVQLIEV